VVVPEDFKFCGDNADLLAFTMPEPKLITFCPNGRTRFTTAVLGNQATIAQVDGTLLDNMRTWGNVFLHEFFHAFGGTNCEFAAIGSFRG
jgi:hypothetical protein